MMEKVKVTQEQAEAIEAFKKFFIENKATSMSNKKLISALNHGYEVEPEFKENQWVITGRGVIGRFAFVRDGLYRFKRDGVLCTSDNLRYATPFEIKQEKERIFWSRHGRKVWELRKGDMLHDESHDYAEIVDQIEQRDGMTAVVFEDEQYSYFCDVKKDYKVVVFAKDRLDVKTNE